MRSVLFALFVTVVAAACGNDTSSNPAPAPSSGGLTMTPAGKALDVFKNQCATCHGDSGKGDGLGAAQLEPKPRNYTDKTWQASVTDDQIKQVILEGGAANGKSPAMPPYKHIFKDDPAALDELVKKIRSFGT